MIFLTEIEQIFLMIFRRFQEAERKRCFPFVFSNILAKQEQQIELHPITLLVYQVAGEGLVFDIDNLNPINCIDKLMNRNIHWADSHSEILFLDNYFVFHSKEDSSTVHYLVHPTFPKLAVDRWYCSKNRLMKWSRQLRE